MKDQQDGQGQGAEDDRAVSHLLYLCSKQSIHISKKVSPRRLPGRGCGIYSTDRILKGERLMHVPTRRLITPNSVPDAFLSKDQQATLPNHALLAAYFAFGLPEGDHRYATWMATWPSLLDFTTSLPMLWPANLLTHAYVSSKDQSKRSRTKSEQRRANKSLLPAPLVDTWSPPLTLPAGSTTSISLQRTMLHKHLSAVATAFPAHSVALLTPDSPIHWRFIHMWCCINTRCFYYPPPPSTSSRSQRGMTTAPDINECLALAPAMDLFNHSSDATARTQYDRTGYFVVADRTYPPGVEIFISYGGHTNDVLWAEYGFMLDHNIDDSVRIDTLLLSSMSSQERLDLSKSDHDEGYWMTREGVSERVSQAAKVTALRGIHQHANDGARSPGVRQKTMKAIIGWMLEMKLECEDCSKRLVSMGKEDVLEAFGSSPDVLKAQNVPVQELELVRMQQAQTRHDMCVKRWEQIAAMVVTVIELCVT